jgi:hypothetical protein
MERLLSTFTNLWVGLVRSGSIASPDGLGDDASKVVFPLFIEIHSVRITCGADVRVVGSGDHVFRLKLTIGPFSGTLVVEEPRILIIDLC